MINESEYAIEIENLCKNFRVTRRAHVTLKGAAAERVKVAMHQTEETPIVIKRALDSITFKVRKGESVALIGRNGSGKSTLLSVLSRVYLPTWGVARIYGRMMSLLELGAGFNMEMTGEENVYFNAAILGLTEEQAQEKYEPIVQFSELSKSTMQLPVRTYSSGMQMRLGFSIAAHMDADILLIDEGIAVGDAGFRVKCNDKMEEFRAQGKTMVHVTHLLDIDHLVDRAIWLENGKIMADGPLAGVRDMYLASYSEEPLPAIAYTA